MNWSKWFIRQSTFCQQNIRFKTYFVIIVMGILLWKWQKILGLLEVLLWHKNVLYLKIMLHLGHTSRISNTSVDNATDLDIGMLIYNLLEYTYNYSMTWGSFWNYYRDEVNNLNDNALDGKSFNYKTKRTGKTDARPA